MREETSAGVIVFRRKGGVAEYLILQNSSKFFWDFPKGNIDAGESEEESAVRELEEEAGLKNVKLLPGFRETAEYFYKFQGEAIHKRLIMFVGEAPADEEVKISWEHSKYDWVPFDVAKSRLKDKKIVLLEKANKFLSGRIENWTK